MFTALVRAHAKEGYILGGHPAKEWLCAVLKEDRSEDVNSTQFRAAMHAGFVRRQLRQQTEPVTARWLVEVIVRSHARMEAAVEVRPALFLTSLPTFFMRIHPDGSPRQARDKCTYDKL